MALMMSLVLGSGLAAINSNSALAQNYGYENDDYSYNNNNSYSDSSYGDSYSQYPTDDNKYECQKGPFEGFFVSSVEFCKHIKFDDRKDHRDNNNTGQQGPQGPKGDTGATGSQGPKGDKGDEGPRGLPGINGTDGTDGTNGTNGRDGTNGTNGRDGTNGTDFDPCVGCLVDALVKLDSGAIVVNASVTIDPPGSTPPFTVIFPVVIDVDVATLLQAQLGEA